MPTSDTSVPEIIRLQLRKPKSWQWELSTSKSSPHIVLPVIQLYDYKGQLVAETADNDGTARKICRSDDVKQDAPGGRSRHLTRSRSDTLNYNFNKKSSSSNNSINRHDRKWKRNDFVKTPVESSEDLKRKPFSIAEKTVPSFPDRNAIEENQRKDNGRGSNRLRKCQSDKCGLEGNLVSLDSNAAERSSLRSFPGSAEKSQMRRHRRSKSDDLFRRKLRYNKEESIKLPEMDCPSNFITPNIPEDGLQEQANKNKTTGRRVMQTADNVRLEHNTRNIEVNNIKQKKYTTRTSSAGTLIIPEESFRNAHRRRQRRDAADDSGRPGASIGVMDRADMERRSSARSTSFRDDLRTVFEEPRPRREEADKRHARQSSDPTAFRGRFGGGSAFNRLNAVLEGADRPEKQRRHVPRNSPSSPTGAYLFYSHSDVFPFERILNGGKSRKIDVCHHNSRNSSAEPAINSSGSRQNSEVITEKLKRKKRRRVRSRKSDESTSSGTMEPGDRRKGKGSFIVVCGCSIFSWICLSLAVADHRMCDR